MAGNEYEVVFDADEMESSLVNGASEGKWARFTRQISDVAHAHPDATGLATGLAGGVTATGVVECTMLLINSVKDAIFSPAIQVTLDVVTFGLMFLTLGVSASAALRKNNAGERESLILPSDDDEEESHTSFTEFTNAKSPNKYDPRKFSSNSNMNTTSDTPAAPSTDSYRSYRGRY